MKKMKKPFALLMATLLAASTLAACGDNAETPEGTEQPADSGQQGEAETTPAPEEDGGAEEAASYIYKDSVSQLCTNWNPHTYQTNDDAYLMNGALTISQLYTTVYNDELHPVDGLEPYAGYVIVPEMAADFPTDVTEAVKAEHPEFGIPESATEGYAWTVPLRDDLKWDNGTVINAETFVESFKRLLDPKLINYRAADAYDGTYAIANAMEYSLSGQPAFKSFGEMGTTYADYIAEGHTDDEVYVDMNGFWGVTAATKYGFAPITDDTMVRDPAVEEGEDEDYVSAKYLYDNYLAAGQPYEPYAADYLGIVEYPYEAGYSYDNVGLYASGENELTFVFKNAFDGYYLMMYAMGTTWLVDPELYDSCLSEQETASGSVWSSTYCTSVETSRSYGPYKLSAYQTDKSMHLVRNENWFGYTDGNHKYVDPEDHETYDMWQTTEIDVQQIAEPTTNKTMFLAGQLMGYALQAEDFDQYRNSEYCYSTPAETVFFLILNGYKNVIEDREQAADFDQATTDIETITLNSFRRAAAVTFDRELMAATVSPARSGGYGLVGSVYIYDPESGATYRDTDQAKRALCKFYSVDESQYASLDEAADSITGYDPETAKELYTQAYNEALEAGYITDADGDGVCDQTITITYAISQDSDFMTKTIDFMNDSFDKATEGTPLYQKIRIVKSAPLGNDWSDQLRDGLVDTCLAGWTGSRMDPFGLTDTWTNSRSAYDAQWFDPSTVSMTVNVDGQDLTTTLDEWSKGLNGTMISIDGQDYNFGYGMVDTEVRLDILAEFESTLMGVYDYIPILQDGGMSLLSQQVYYVVEDYSPVMGRGGIQYMKYNYSESEWDEYVQSQNGQLQY